MAFASNDEMELRSSRLCRLSVNSFSTVSPTNTLMNNVLMILFSHRKLDESHHVDDELTRTLTCAVVLMLALLL